MAMPSHRLLYRVAFLYLVQNFIIICIENFFRHIKTNDVNKDPAWRQVKDQRVYNIFLFNCFLPVVNCRFVLARSFFSIASNGSFFPF